MAYQLYQNPADHFTPNSFAAAPSAAGNWMNYGQSAQYMTNRNQIRAAIPGANIVNGMPQTAGGAPMSPLDRLYGEFKTQQEAAKQANLDRYGQASALLEMDANGRPLPSTVDPHAASWGTGKIDPLAPIDAPTFEGASPTEAAVNLDATKRGIYNTSSIMNEANLGKTMDAFNARNATYDRTYRSQQSQLAQRELDRNRDERLRTDRVSLITSRNDTGPDEGMMAQLAMKYGAGTTAGLSPGAFGGGYGGGGMPSYGLPQFPNNGINYGGSPTARTAKPPMPKAAMSGGAGPGAYGSLGNTASPTDFGFPDTSSVSSLTSLPSYSQFGAPAPAPATSGLQGFAQTYAGVPYYANPKKVAAIAPINRSFSTLKNKNTYYGN